MSRIPQWFAHLSAAILLLTATVSLSVAANAPAYPPPAPPKDTSDFGKNYQRTMRLLATSTPKCHHKVKILI